MIDILGVCKTCLVNSMYSINLFLPIKNKQFDINKREKSLKISWYYFTSKIVKNIFTKIFKSKLTGIDDLTV